MKNFVCKIVILLFMVTSIIACTSKLTYKKDFGDPASPGDKEFVFSLRNSTILVSQSGMQKETSGTEKKEGDGKKAADQADSAAITPVNSCPEPKQGEEKMKLNNCLRKCLFPVTAKATATLETDIFYVASPGFRTTVTSATVDDNPFMVKSIAVNYSNPLPGIVTSAGGGAAAGFGIGGPWGAVVGGLLGAVEGFLAPTKPPTKAKGEWKYGDDVCQEDMQPDTKEFKKRVHELKSADDEPPQLFLPVALPYKTSASESICWHPLPNRSDKAQDAAMEDPPKDLLSGWFYRIVAVDPKPDESKLPPILPTELPSAEGEKLKPPFQKRGEYFGIAGSQETFPVSACRSVELQITWWEMLMYRKPDKEAMHYKYTMMVADSDYVQAIRLPQSGTVYLLPACGGYASPTQSSSSLGDLIDAVVKQAQAVKDAQDKYKKAQKDQ